jgi:ubiquitin C
MLIEARDWQSDAVRSILIDASPRNTVLAVKKAIEGSEVIGSNLQRLSYGGRLLRDERALEDYQIDNTSTLQMWWCKCMACRALSADQTCNTMRVYVTTPREQTIPLTVSRNGSVFSVKAKLRDAAGAPAARQRLIFNDEELVNGQTLTAYNIAKNSVLRMLHAEPEGAMPVAVFIAILERTITLDVRRTDTIRDLKAMLHQAEGIPPFHQRLKPRFSYGFFNREMNNADLSDDATLADLNVTRGDSFFLLRRSKHHADCPCFECCGESFHFFVKTVLGKSIVVDLKSFHTVEAIKRKVHEKEGIAIHKQRLLLGDLELDDDKTLFDYNIEVDSIIRLVVVSGAKSGFGSFFSRVTGS